MERSIDGERWLAAGSSTDVDARRAGGEAARQALAGPDPRLLLVFCAGSRDPHAVVAGIAAEAGDVPIVGCSATATIGPDGPSRDGVAVIGLGGPGFSVATTASTAERPRAAGAQVAGCVAAAGDRPHRVLVLLTDGLTPDQEDVIAGVYGEVGASVPLVGGSASPGEPTGQTFQFHGTDVLTGAVVGAAIASDAPFGVGLRHGWRKVGEPMIVTGSTRGDVYTLDDRPALEAYLQRLDAPPEAYTDPAAFEAFSQTRPLGVRRRSGEEVRAVSSVARFDQGWLQSSGEVPEGGLVWPMEGDTETALDAADDACRDAVGALGGHPPLGFLAFDCESRARLLGDSGMRREVGRMAGQTAGVPIAGLYTWGEIARNRGINGFHHQTLVVLAVG